MSIFSHRFSWKNRKENVSRDAHFLCCHKAHSHNAAPSVGILGIKIPEEVLAMLLEASFWGTGNDHFMSLKPKASRLQKSSLRIQPSPASTSPSESQVIKSAVCQLQLSKAKYAEHPKFSGCGPFPGSLQTISPKAVQKNHTKFSQQASDKKRI